MVSKLQYNMVLTNSLSLYPRLDHYAHYPLKKHTNSELGSLRGSVYSLHTGLHLPLFFIQGLVTKHWRLPTSVEKPAPCDT